MALSARRRTRRTRSPFNPSCELLEARALLSTVYAVKELGTSSTVFSPYYGGINDAGQIAGGWSSYSSQYHAFLSGPNGGAIQDLGIPGGQTYTNEGSYATAVNNAGQVVINDFVNSPGENVGVFLSGPNGNGPVTSLGNPAGTYPYVLYGFGVNSSGQVTGDSEFLKNSVPYEDAFLSGPNGGALKDLGTLPSGTYSPYSIGNAVNDTGQVTGESQVAAGGQHAFLSAPNGGALQDLGTLPGGTSSPKFQGRKWRTP